MSTQTITTVLKFRPGLYRQSTTYGEEGGWYDCDRVRFRDGFPENMRGSTVYSQTSIAGTARDIISWTDFYGNKNIVYGTECKLFLNQGTVAYDITPIVSSQTLTNAINTSAGSQLVVISVTNNLTENTEVIFADMSATVGGNVFLSGSYNVSVINASSFQITYVSAATATSAATGTVSISYLLNCGLSTTQTGLGWGVGTWGSGTWGTPRTGSGILLNVQQWSLQNWGQDLLANVRGGSIYVWSPTSGTGARAQLISAAPSIVDHILVTDEQRHLMAFGCSEEGGPYDAMLIRWSDSEDYTVWTPTVTNAAGDFLLTGGSRIVGAITSKGQNLVWTDAHAHAVRFVGQPFVFSFSDLAENCGLVGKHAAVDANGVVYWMSTNNFYVYDGAVRNLPSYITQDVFADFNFTQRDKVFAGVNAEFNEIIWLYCSAASDEVDRYVIYNVKDQIFYWGNFTYTVWEDSATFGNIIAIQPDDFIVNVEPAGVFSDVSVAYDSFVQSADFDIGDGQQIMFMDRVIPDFVISDGTDITIQLQGKMFPGVSSYTTKGPYTVSSGTRYVRTRLRARQANIRIGCSVIGSWNLGHSRVDIGPDGAR